MNIKSVNFSLKKINCSVLLLLLLTCVGGCGGGGGVYFPPKVAKNTINLQKIALAKTGIVSYEKQFFPILYSQRHLRNRVREAGKKIFDDEGYFQEVKFNGADYYLYKSYYFKEINVTRKSDMKKILSLSTPRSFYVFSSFPIKMNNQNYLVIYIQQRGTSHSSTLFLLDSKFKIVYQEHLLGAIAIGYTHSGKYGNCIVIESEDFWFPNGRNTTKVTINGNWLYYMKPERDKLK
jgi:predicted small lipoprotein YifL